MACRRLPVFVAVLAGFLVAAAEPKAQPCYRLRCDQTQRCQAGQTGQSGECCCRVLCEGGEGGVTCTCSTWCNQPCGASRPSCNICPEAALAAEREPGFILTPEAHDTVRQQHLLAAQVLSNLSDGLSHPVYSVIAQGKSNAASWYDYSYKVRITAAPSQAVLDFVFAPPAGAPGPQPVRVTVDGSGNVSATSLSPEEVERVRAEGAATQP